MTSGTFFAFWPLLLGIFAAQPGQMQAVVTRLVVHDEVIWRVPVLPRPMGAPVDWIEHKGPKCVPVEDIRRALLNGAEQVDFVMTDRSRVRAQFDEDCPALDFYAGFYLQPEDDRLCAKRDAVHSRVGGSCQIKRFRMLEPRLRH